MAIYTGVADANGDFIVPFSSAYTSGQKVTVTAEKDSAVKTIELFAPSDAIGGGIIQFSGTMNNFPNDIGNVTITGITGIINADTFDASGSSERIWKRATGLTINAGVTEIASGAFKSWIRATFLNMPDSLLHIKGSAFIAWSGLLEISIPNSVLTISNSAFQQCGDVKKITLGSGLTSIENYAFGYFSKCDEILSLASTPPIISANTFVGLKAGCVFKVPFASLAAYQSAVNWSAFASQMVGV